MCFSTKPHRCSSLQLYTFAIQLYVRVFASDDRVVTVASGNIWQACSIKGALCNRPLGKLHQGGIDLQEALRFEQRFAAFNVITRPEALTYHQYTEMMHPSGAMTEMQCCVNVG